MKLITFMLAVCFPVLAFAGGLKFGLVAKSTSDHNFVDAWRGCQELAQKDGNECILLGDEGPASPHTQTFAIEQALSSGAFSALAISVTNSEFIAQSVFQSAIPILTFDSPFSQRNLHLQRAYIGTDNSAFGRDLALMAKLLKPNGGSLCIFTIDHDPNLAKRVEAVRQTLAGDIRLSPDQALRGEGGWYEAIRCPSLSQADSAQALIQLEGTLSLVDPDMIISVGHWPIENPESYRRTIAPFKDRILKGNNKLVVGVGFINDEYKQLIADDIVHGFVSIDFVEIGRVTYQRMKEAAKGKMLPPTSYTPNRFIPSPVGADQVKLAK